MTSDTGPSDKRSDALTSELSPAELVSLTSGVDMWHLPGEPRLGLRRIKVSDGPAGVRGSRWFGGSSACVPCGSALGATWSPAVVAEVGAVLARDVRRKGADVLLAPTVNLHRHPLAGRNFECFSEDPELTAALATAYIAALQGMGVGACVKHFVANDQETDRHDISAEVPEVAMRELYLRPFEAAVRDAGTWSIMSAYNRVAGTHCSQNHWLLTEVLRDEWGFDGAVISDWWGTKDTAALAAGLDVEMPGPSVFLGPAAQASVADGSVPLSAVERAACSILQLADRVDALSDPYTASHELPAEESFDDPGDRDVLRRATVESLVLLRNEPGSAGNAPLVPLPHVSTVAVIGPNADATAIMGGGSASFVANRITDVLSSLRSRLGAETEVLHERGTPAPEMLGPLDRRQCRTSEPGDSPPGFVLDHFDSTAPDGDPVLSETSLTGRVFWMGAPAPGVAEQNSSIRLRTWLTPTRTGTHTFSLITGATGWVRVKDQVLLDNRDDRQPGTAFFGLGSAETRAQIQLEEGVPVPIEAVTTPIEGVPLGGLSIGHSEPEDPDPLARAVEAAGRADIAVVVVGGDDQWETEGTDRAGFDLPGGQPDLVRAVVAANPNTIVLVNCGAPVSLDCAQDAPALLQVWYPGQEAGEAIADVLVGDADPGGRLPTTFGHRLTDWASDNGFPGAAGTVSYDEGLNMGYRGFDSAGIEPAFCFGHGLSTATFHWATASLTTGSLDAASVAEGPGECAVDVVVTNTGSTPGTEVVQCYLSPTSGHVVDSARPPQHLAGFAKVYLGPGESTTVRIGIGWTALRRWEPGSGWTVPTGTWEVRVSASSRDHRFRLPLRLTAG